MAMAMATATMSLKESEKDLVYARLKSWIPGKGFPPPSDPPSDPPPKWRGAAQRFFMSNGPNPAYSIAQRARDIAWGFVMIPVIPKKDRDEYCSSDDEDEDENEETKNEKPEGEQLVKWLKGLLDELQEYDVESIDVATLLHSYGYLLPFLRDVLSNKHACIRAKAAELITSMVQNRPTSQQLVIQANGLQPLLHNFTTDPDTTSRTNALGAISSLIRNNKSGITVFLRENGGYEALRNALISGTVLAGSSTHGEVFKLIDYLRRESSSLYSPESNLKFGDDSEARKGGNSGQLGKFFDKPKQDNSKKRRNYSSLKKKEEEAVQARKK